MRVGPSRAVLDGQPADCGQDQLPRRFVPELFAARLDKGDQYTALDLSPLQVRDRDFVRRLGHSVLRCRQARGAAQLSFCVGAAGRRHRTHRRARSQNPSRLYSASAGLSGNT
jgi:hypothetical protein